MKVKDNQFLAKAIALSILCMAPMSVNAQIGIHTGGDIDTKLNISIDNPEEDNSGIEYTSSTSGTSLNIKKGGTITVAAKGNAYGIRGEDNHKTPSFITVGGDELNISATNGATNIISGGTPGGYGAIGVWSSTNWNPLGTGQPTYLGGQITLNSDVTNIKIDAKRNGFGILAGSAFGNNSNEGGYVEVNGKLNIDVKGALLKKNPEDVNSNRSIGVAAYAGRVDLNNDTKITVQSSAFNNQKYPFHSEIAGLLAGGSGYINTAANKKLEINVIGNSAGSSSNVFGINVGVYDSILADKTKPNVIKDRASVVNLNGTSNILLDAQKAYGVASYIYSTVNANTLSINFSNNNADTKKDQIGLVAYDASTINVNNLFIANDQSQFTKLDKITAITTDNKFPYIDTSAGRMWFSRQPVVNVNTNEQGTVQINGSIENNKRGTIDLRLTNANSYLYSNFYLETDWDDNPEAITNLTLKNGATWKNFSALGWQHSMLTNLTLDNKALLDMTHNEYSGNKLFQDIYINKNMSGTNATINMDIDAGTNTNNSDRLYIAGTHTGNHYITLNNVNSEGKIDGAAGTVLVSVNNEQGKFFANDHEGSLYWYKYSLDSKPNEQAGSIYNTDWYLKEVEVIPALPLGPAFSTKPKPTTSVEAVDATQRLAFANWVEDDKLMQRMGDLRHETNNEEGVWVRVKGGKYSGDGFSNRHTMYQIGYDDVVKNTDKLKRYQGVAFSYDDGKNSFNRGSGKLKAKSIGFYNTDLRNKGHYLDLVFKIYDADSDFTVFDTEGKKITGAFDNTGISLSAEYGRKKYLDEHWSIEPQAQLTLGYLGGARYTTSNGIYVSQSDPNSVLGRIGCNFMYDMDEKNTVYLKANWLHQFAGNYGVTLTNGNDSLRIDNHDHDTWFEYGFGFACMTGKNNHLYADVERSTGGSLRKNWQWNAGMFWTF